MSSKVSPTALPPTGLTKRTGSLHSIKYEDTAVEAEAVGGIPVDLDEETKWINRHVKKRECSHFVPNKKSTPDIKNRRRCHCDYTFSEHSNGAQKNELNENTNWDYKHHSIQKKTDAFGEIEFVGYAGSTGKYIRVDIDTKMSDMLDLMMNVWGLDKPNLLISVTGGAKNFQMNKRLKDNFRRGLMNTALTTGAWIVTGGTHAGVMKHVGEAVKDFGIASTSKNPVIAIGIAPWGCIQNKDSLVNDSCSGLWPANYRIEKEQKAKESFLDPNHSHFILVDNATQHKFGTEIPFRARLENEVSKIRTDTGENAVSVPIVLLVLEGGPGTLQTVHQAIQNNTPAVIVKGSGRAADILAYAYQSAKEEEIEANDQEGKKIKKTHRLMDDALLMEVRDMVEREFITDVDLHIGRIKDCLEKSDLMSVYEMDSRGGVKRIDVAMLQALLKANRNQIMDQLRLALAWNRIDVVKSDIFTDDKRWPTGSLDDVMLSAIQLNRADFVELFLDHGVSLREFLTKKRLLLLYNKTPQNCLLRTLLERVKAKDDPLRKNFSLMDVGLLIQNLMGDTYRTNYTTNIAYASLDADFMLDGTTTRQAKEGLKSGMRSIAKALDNTMQIFDTKDPLKNGGQQSPDFDNPAQELFIWSVLSIKQTMAKLFWADGKDAIAAALVANSLLRAMKDKTEDTELVITIQENVDEWSNLSVGVLSECYSTDEHKAQDLLVRELSNWGDTTCMMIAVKADNKDFISQTACQSLLNSIWMGKLSLDNSTWRLLLCTVFPPFALVILHYHPDQAAKMNSRIKNQEFELDTKKSDAAKQKVLRRQTTMIRTGTMTGSMTGSRTSLQPMEEKEATGTKSLGKQEGLSFKDKIYYFFNAPVIIFMNNVLSYIVFLGLFTYVLIFNFNPTVSISEWVLMGWVFTIFAEEIRQISRDFLARRAKQVAATSSSTLVAKLQSYVTDTWNIVDMITIGLFIIGIILRFLPYPSTFEAARVFLALNFVSFFLRLLHIFSVHKELGPKLVMIGRMVQDLMYFLVILMVFVISFAIASHSILYPNSPLRWMTAIDVIKKSYWNIYGELFLEEIQGSADCTYDEMLWLNGTQPRCPTDTGKVFVPILMGVYMLLANVLLLNLLIAMFSYTFNAVQENTDKHWFFQRYSLIYEYYTRPVLCPPLIFFAHVYLLFKFIITHTCCRGKLSDFHHDDFRRKYKNERELVQWENVIADSFHQKSELKDTESMDYKVNTTYNLMHDMTIRLDELQEHQSMVLPMDRTAQTLPVPVPMTPKSPSNVVVQMPTKLEQKLNMLESELKKHTEATHNALNWIMNVLQEGKVARDQQAPYASFKWDEKKKKVKRRKEAKQKELNRMVFDMLQKGIDLHYRARTSPYQFSDVERFPVPDDKVNWKTDYPGYLPPIYTANSVLEMPVWADPDIMDMSIEERLKTIASFNKEDTLYQVNRVSYTGTYAVVDGLPVNPIGRTGMRGRGLLGRWGPNHAGDPIVTRWKLEDGEQVMKENKPVLEVVAVLRSDNRMWALPGVILKPDSLPADHLKAEFTEEAMGDLAHMLDEKTSQKKLKKLWKKGEKVYEGYADDPRNTDNAWIETVAYSYHDNDGTILNKFNLRAGGTVDLASWITVSHKMTMHGSHLHILKIVCDKLDAYF